MAHYTALVFTAEPTDATDSTDDEQITMQMLPHTETQWDYWRVISPSVPAAELSQEQYDDADAVVRLLEWYGKTHFYPWRKRKQFTRAEFPPLEWLRQQEGHITLVDYHY